MKSQTLYLVRHAQGFHNLALANHQMPDPLLTEFGKEQCRAFHDSFPDMNTIECIVASPLKRTMHTALICFRSIIARKNLRVIALPEVQEMSNMPCDIGSSLEELEREFNDQPVDLSRVAAQSEWTSKKGDWAPCTDATIIRAR